MVLCSTACGVTLAQDRATIEAMPNGTENLSIYSDNDIETYRDVLFYVGQVLGGFFVINRSGEMCIRDSPDTPDEWLDQFGTFSIYQVLPEIIELWGLNVQTQVESKKNFERLTGK